MSAVNPHSNHFQERRYIIKLLLKRMVLASMWLPMVSGDIVIKEFSLILVLQLTPSNNDILT